MKLREWMRVVATVVVCGVLFLLSTEHVLAVQVGDKALDFSLPATTAEKISLADYLGKKPVLVFFSVWAFNPV